MLRCGFVRSNFSFAMFPSSSELGVLLRSGGGARTRDLTIMSRALSPTELLRRVRRVRRPVPASPLADSNRRPLPYHGSALPTELRGQGPESLADQVGAIIVGSCARD